VKITIELPSLHKIHTVEIENDDVSMDDLLNAVEDAIRSIGFSFQGQLGFVDER
jgi:hypothetical protein